MRPIDLSVVRPGFREYFIPDFSNWEDHDSYTNAFARLKAPKNKGAQQVIVFPWHDHGFDCEHG